MRGSNISSLDMMESRGELVLILAFDLLVNGALTAMIPTTWQRVCCCIWLLRRFPRNGWWAHCCTQNTLLKLDQLPLRWIIIEQALSEKHDFVCMRCLALLSFPLPSFAIKDTFRQKKWVLWLMQRRKKVCMCEKKEGVRRGIQSAPQWPWPCSWKNSSTHWFFTINIWQVWQHSLWFSGHRVTAESRTFTPATSSVSAHPLHFCFLFSMFLMMRVPDRCSSCLHSFITSPPQVPGGLAAALCLQEDSESQLQESKRKGWIYKKKGRVNSA